jgi:prepilin-type N-terminal cleavage/methylation domain-containing protein
MKKGFSLIEVVVVALILSIVAMAVFSLYAALESSWTTDMGLIELQRNIRLCFDGMTRELRQVKPSQVSIPNSQTITFSIPNHAGTISYYLQGNQIIREYPAGAKKPLANDITYLNFCCQGGANCSDCNNAKVIKIQAKASGTFRGRILQLPQNANDSCTEEILMRNK